jgi:hypothetical protein
MTGFRNSRSKSDWRAIVRRRICCSILTAWVAVFLFAGPHSAWSQSDISVQPLPEVRTDTVGVLKTNNGGLEPDLWQESDVRIVETLLGQAEATSPATWSLLRRLALTVAPPPGGDDDGMRLFAARADLLWRLNDLDGLDDLLSAAPRSAESEAVRRLNTERQFLDGDNDAACGLVRDEIGVAQSDYWRRALIACQALSGERSRAELGIALIREIGDAADAAFADLVVNVLSESEGSTVTQIGTAYEFALARHIEAALPLEAVAQGHLSLIGAVATAPWLPRLIAAERLAAAGGSLTPLRDVLGGETPDAPADAVLPPPVKTDAAPPRFGHPIPRPTRRQTPTQTSPGNAASPENFYRAVVNAQAPAETARALDAALVAAQLDWTQLTAAYLYAPWLDDLTLDPETAGVALNAARAALARRQVATARAWLGLALSEADGPTDRNTIALLTGVATIVDESQAGPTRARLDTNAFAAIIPDVDQRSLALGVADALGFRITADQWLPLLNAEPLIPTVGRSIAEHRLLQGAIKDGRRGEAVLLALSGLGGAGTRRADADALIMTIEALIAVGLPEDARALAAEALVDRL